MKKMLILLGLSLLVCSLVAEDFMQPAQVAKGGYTQGMRYGVRNMSRDQDPAPEYFFIPNGASEFFTYLSSTHYDYMPFSYNGHNLNKQPETSMPYGYPADGWYVSYMRSETPSVNTDRRAYYSYINSDGTLGQSNSIVSDVYREGYTSLAIDPYTGDPFAAWHATEDNGDYCSWMSYALYHATSSPGSWRVPFILIDNPEMSEPLTGHSDDEFIWPQVWVGPSPLPDHRRVHAYGNNYTGSNYNSLYLYADFDDMDLLTTSDLDWTVKTFPYFDVMNYDDIARVNKDLIVSEVDGKVVFFGSVADSLFAMYSDDYGETFTKYTQQLKQPLDNPAYENSPDSLLFGYNNDGETPSEMFIIPAVQDMSHFNGAFSDYNTKVLWMAGVNYNSQENMDTGWYIPAYLYPKQFTFDTVTGEFSFYDLDIQGLDPADDIMTIGFDLDEDGEVDEYYEDGRPVVVMSYPSWFFAGAYVDGFFHESNNKMVSNGNWLATVWYDGSKLFNAFYEEEGYDGWEEQAELAIIISDDNGATWSDIRYINANPNDAIIDSTGHYDGNYAPELGELEGKLPTEISLGDKLEILSNVPGNYHAKLHFVFMDDLDYGSGAIDILGSITNNSLYYGAIDLEFQEEWINPVSTNDVTVTPNAELLGQNYPNPFNPTTTIAYNMVEDGNVSIEVFNVKGQLVKTLINEHIEAGDHTLVWEGTNNNNHKVSSGIYFYKMKSGNYSSTKKMILMK